MITLEHVAEDRVHERLLRCEAAVQRAGPDAGFARDVVHARLEPVLEEEPAGSVEDPLAVGSRVAAQVRLARHGVQGSEKRRRLSGSDNLSGDIAPLVWDHSIHATHPPRQHYNVTFAVLALAGAAFALLQSLVVPALGTIEDDLNASPTAGAWIITAYLLSASVATPIAGRIGDMFGKKRTLVVVLAVLALGTLVSALATTIGVMIAGRVIQGIGGAVFPLAFAIIRDEFPREKVPVGIAMISSILGDRRRPRHCPRGADRRAPRLPLAVLAAAGGRRRGRNRRVRGDPGVAGEAPWPDQLGRRRAAVGLARRLLRRRQPRPCLGMDVAARPRPVRTGRRLCVAWVVAESRSDASARRHADDAQRSVWTTNLTAFLFGFGMFGSFILVPALVESPASSGVGFGASVTQAGLYLLPSTAGMLLVSPIAGRLSSRRLAHPADRRLARLAASFVVLVVAHDQPWQIYASSALLGIGLGLAFSSMANLIVERGAPARLASRPG